MIRRQVLWDMVLCVYGALWVAGCGAPVLPVAGGAEALIDFRTVISAAKNKVFPTVVFIKVIKESHDEGRKITEEVAGSGVIISADGEVLTNWHVIDKAVSVRCLLYNGQAFGARVLGSDKEMDLALLKLAPEGAPVAAGLPCAVLGASGLLKEGDFVMAMGAPWGLSRSVSLGIISCTRRFLPQASEYTIWIQTDAAISPGNSGGPLVNTAGEVVGINTRGVMFGGDMGFAIPMASVRLYLPQLREHGRIEWSYTGLQLQPLRDFNKDSYFDADRGVIVAGTDPGSPARQAGFQIRDRITAVNGTPVNGVTEEDLPVVRRILGGLPRDTAVSFTVVRDGTERTIPLTPRIKGKVEGDELDCPRWDMTVKSVNQFDNPELYFQKKEGVFVFGVKMPGNAMNAGIRHQDVLLKIDGQDVITLDDVRRIHTGALGAINAKNKVPVTVLRNGLVRQMILDFGRDYEKE
ncbi:MAG: trypsin-like peptidase domain-containing protein [Planctomycetota bacterium]